jgi:excisionase family DNA binding protein
MQDLILSPVPISTIETYIRDAVIQAVQIALRNEQTERQNDAANEAPEEIITREEAAEILKISLPTLHKLTMSGRVPAYRLGSQVRYKSKEVEQALKKIIIRR